MTTPMNETAEQIAAGLSVQCARCSGHGLVTSIEGANWPDECSDCGGSGRNWQYPNGAIARYYSGPFIGRTILKAQP